MLIVQSNDKIQWLVSVANLIDNVCHTTYYTTKQEYNMT